MSCEGEPSSGAPLKPESSSSPEIARAVRSPPVAPLVSLAPQKAQACAAPSSRRNQTRRAALQLS